MFYSLEKNRTFFWISRLFRDHLIETSSASKPICVVKDFKHEEALVPIQNPSRGEKTFVLRIFDLCVLKLGFWLKRCRFCFFRKRNKKRVFSLFPRTWWNWKPRPCLYHRGIFLFSHSLHRGVSWWKDTFIL